MKFLIEYFNLIVNNDNLSLKKCIPWSRNID